MGWSPRGWRCQVVIEKAATKDALANVVGDTQEAISREHTIWGAKRGLGPPRAPAHSKLPPIRRTAGADPTAWSGGGHVIDAPNPHAPLHAGLGRAGAGAVGGGARRLGLRPQRPGDLR